MCILHAYTQSYRNTTPAVQLVSCFTNTYTNTSICMNICILMHTYTCYHTLKPNSPQVLEESYYLFIGNTG